MELCFLISVGTLNFFVSGKICREDGEVDPECFVECQKFALDNIDKE